MMQAVLIVSNSFRRHEHYHMVMSMLMSTPTSVAVDRVIGPIDRPCLDNGCAFAETHVNRAIWVFLVMGIIVRSMRYLLCFPLWEDECYLLSNFVDRDYIGLLEALDYHQVAPVLFLWSQRAMIDLLGFNEYSVRLIPFAGGIASLFLFRRFASRLVKGPALVLAVAIFAVAYPCIRYAAEAKPYGTDVFASLVLLTLAVEWWRDPERTGWLWGLCLSIPLAVGFSYPAVFVAGGVSLAVACVGWIDRCRRVALPWVCLNVALLASFGIVYVLATSTQAESELGWMGVYWQRTFPPITEPLALAGWLIVTHTSEMLTYPIGGARGASSLTFICCATALVVAAYQRRVPLLVLCLTPLALNFIAAALHRYPYGGHMRFGLYLAPVFCLLAGLGGWEIVRRLHGGRIPRQALAAVLGLLFVIGATNVARDIAHPYKTTSDMRARDFARWFWFTNEFDSEVACLYSDLDRDFSPETRQDLSWFNMYLCNLHIYSPRHARREKLDWERISSERPLHCVEYRVPAFEYDHAAHQAWLDEMAQDYERVGHRSIPVPRYDKHDRKLIALDTIEVDTFVPRTADNAAPSKAAGAEQNKRR
jgi:hypothetical protein